MNKLKNLNDVFRNRNAIRFYINGEEYIVDSFTIPKPSEPVEVTCGGFGPPPSTVREFRQGLPSGSMIIDLIKYKEL